MLMGLPYAVLYCRRDNSLTALLSSRGVSCFKILLSEYISHLASLACLLAVIFGAVAVADGLLGLEFFKNTEGCPFLYVMPAVIMLSAFYLMIFELSSGVISGVLTHFFLSLSLCYISGCFYPIHSFPAAVQKLSALLPTGLAREQLAGFFTGESGIAPTLFVLLYAAAFFAVTLLAKRIRLMSRTGGVA